MFPKYSLKRSSTSVTHVRGRFDDIPQGLSPNRAIIRRRKRDAQHQGAWTVRVSELRLREQRQLRHLRWAGLVRRVEEDR